MKKSILLALTTTLVFASLSAFAECPGNGAAKDGRSVQKPKVSTDDKEQNDKEQKQKAESAKR